MKRINCANCYITNSDGLIKWEQMNQALRWLNEEICKRETDQSLPPIKHFSKYHFLAVETFEIQSFRLYLPPTVIPGAYSTVLSAKQLSLPASPAEVTPSPLPLSQFLVFPFSILITKRENRTGFTCKAIPQRFPLGCCCVWLSVWGKDWIQAYNLGSHRASPEGAPASNTTQPVPQFQPIPQAQPLASKKGGVFSLFQGAGLMGKSWQDDQGKLTPSLRCFMKAWQTCRQPRKKSCRGGESRNI